MTPDQQRLEDVRARFKEARDSGDLDTARKLAPIGRELEAKIKASQPATPAVPTPLTPEGYTPPAAPAAPPTAPQAPAGAAPESPPAREMSVPALMQERNRVKAEFIKAKQNNDRPALESLSGQGRSLDAQIKKYQADGRISVDQEVAGALEDQGPDEVLKSVDKMTASDFIKSPLAALINIGKSSIDSAETEFRSESGALVAQERERVNNSDLSPEEKKKRLAWADRMEKEQIAGNYDSMGSMSFYSAIIRPLLNKGEIGQSATKYITDLQNSESKRAQAAEKEPWVSPNAEWKDPTTWFEGTKLTSLDSFALGMVQVAPSILSAIVSARIGGKIGAKAESRALRREGIVNPDVVRKRMAAAGGRGGVVGGSGMEYIQSRDSVTQQTEQALHAQWDKEEFWQDNVDYLMLIDAGHSPTFAKQVITNRYATLAGESAGVATAILGAPMNHYLGKLGLEAAASRTGASVKAGFGEAFQESIQSTAEQLVQNIAERKVDPSTPYTKDLANQFVGGLFGGFGMGALSGAIAGGDNGRSAMMKESRELEDAGFSDWRKYANQRSKLGQKIHDPQYVASTPASQQVADYIEHERLQLEEAKAFKRSEPTIRRLQVSLGKTGANELKTTDTFSRRYDATIRLIAAGRAQRGDAESRAASERQIVRDRDEKLKSLSADEETISTLKQAKEDLRALQNTEVLTGEDIEARYQSIVDKGWGRWTNRTKTDFAVTQSGKAAVDTIDASIETLEGRVRSGYTGPERRSQLALRKKVEAMSDEELSSFVHDHPLTKMKNKRAFDDVESFDGPAKAYASVDVDTLKWVNDNMGGHGKGDELLKTVARAFKGSGLEAYHVHGDEVTVRGGSQEEIEVGMQKVKAALQAARPVTNAEGQGFQPTVTWATGETFKAADVAMNAMKNVREAAGKRAGRGEAPKLIEPESDTSIPLFSNDESNLHKARVKLQSLVDLWSGLSEKNDEFSKRRVDTISKRIRDIREAIQSMDSIAARDLSEKAEAIRQSIGNPRELKARWWAMSDADRLVYQQKADQFWTLYAGQHVSGLEVFQYEHGVTGPLEGKIPSTEMDSRGNAVPRHMSESVARLNRIFAEGLLPRSVVQQAEHDRAMLDEGGWPGISLGEVMSNIVTGYVEGMYLVTPLTPFSENVDGYEEALDSHADSLLPLFSVAARPGYDDQFYAGLRKGDRVEVLVNAESVIGVVDSIGDNSAVISWDKGPVIGDPDTKTEGRTARFSTVYGWQVSARYARGGKAYSKQFNAMPRQGILGRRWNPSTSRWESPRDIERRQEPGIRGYASHPYKIHPALKNARYTRPTQAQVDEMAQAVNGFISTMWNRPNIKLRLNPTQIPEHLQQKIVDHAETGRGVAGMFDEEDTRNGIWLFAGRIADMAIERGITVGEAAAETVAHELVGHFGIRGLMGSDAMLVRWTDAMHKSFGPEIESLPVAAKWRRPQLVDGKIKMMWISEEAKRVAAEEWLAERIQAAYMYGETIPAPQLNFLQRIFAFVRARLVSMGAGRFFPILKDQDIALLMARSQDYVRSGRAFQYVTKGGRHLGAFTKDVDLFVSSTVHHFEIATRRTTSDERKQMKKNGIAPAEEVPLFPEEGMTRQGYIQAFDKLASEGKISKAEKDWMDVAGTLSWLNADAFINMGVGHALPEDLRVRVIKESAASAVASSGKLISDIRAILSDINTAIEKIEAMPSDEATYEDVESLLPMNLLRSESLNMPTIGETVQGLKVRADAYALGIRLMQPAQPGSPEEADRVAAEKELQVLRASIGPESIPKKTKYPKEMVRQLLAAGSLKITVSPSNGYTINDDVNRSVAETREFDINADTWLQATRDPSYSTWKFWPAGSYPIETEEAYDLAENIPPMAGRHFAYSVFQDYPNQLTVAPDGAHDFNTPRGGIKADHPIGHIRASMRKNADGTWDYVLAEVQSDVYQKIEGAYENASAREAAVQKEKEYRSALNTMSRAVHADISELYFSELRKLFEEYGGGEFRNQMENYLAVPAQDYDLAVQVWNDFTRAFNRLHVRSDAVANKLVEYANNAKKTMRKDDARAFLRLDSVAFADVLKEIGESLSMVPNLYAGTLASGGSSGVNLYNLLNDPELFWKSHAENLSADLFRRTDKRGQMHRVVGKQGLLSDLYSALLGGTSGMTDEELVAHSVSLHESLVEKSGATTLTVSMSEPPAYLTMPSSLPSDGRTGRDGGRRFIETALTSYNTMKVMGALGVTYDRSGVTVGRAKRKRGDEVSFEIGLPALKVEGSHSIEDAIAAAIVEYSKGDGGRAFVSDYQAWVAAQREEYPWDAAHSKGGWYETSEAYREAFLKEINFRETTDEGGGIADGDPIPENVTGDEGWRFGRAEDNRDLEAFDNVREGLWNNDRYHTIDGMADLEMVDGEGRLLNSDHPQYEARVTGDEDDPDYSDADAWLEGARERWAYDNSEWSSDAGELIREHMTYHDLFPEYSNPDLDEEDPDYDSDFDYRMRRWEFRTPVAWDENGEPTDWADGMIAKSAKKPGNALVPLNYQIFIGGRHIDYWFDVRRSLRTVHTMVLEAATRYVMDQNGTIPSDSIWGWQRAAIDADSDSSHQDLAVSRRDNPEADAINPANGVNNLSVGDVTPSDVMKEDNPEAVWSQAVMLGKAANAPLESGPLRKVWKNILWKLAIADAVRRGANRIFMHPGEASGSRGGWGDPSNGAAERVDKIQWKKVVINLPGGKTQDAFEIRTDRNSVPFQIDEKRMAPIIGFAVTRRLIDESKNPEKYLKPKGDAALKRFKVVSVGKKYALIDVDSGSVLEEYASIVAAETARIEQIKLYSLPLHGAEEGTDENGYRTLTTEDIGGNIYVALTNNMDSGYSDTLPGTEARVAGARQGYEVSAISAANSLVRKYGASFKEGRLQLADAKEILASTNRDGGQVTLHSGMNVAQLENSLVVENQRGYYFVATPQGMASRQLHQRKDEADSERTSLIKEAIAGGGFVNGYELVLNDQVREAFKAGKMPILSSRRPNSDHVLASEEDAKDSVERLAEWRERNPSWFPRSISAGSGLDMVATYKVTRGWGGRYRQSTMNKIDKFMDAYDGKLPSELKRGQIPLLSRDHSNPGLRGEELRSFLSDLKAWLARNPKWSQRGLSLASGNYTEIVSHAVKEGYVDTPASERLREAMQAFDGQPAPARKKMKHADGSIPADEVDGLISEWLTKNPAWSRYAIGKAVGRFVDHVKTASSAERVTENAVDKLLEFLYENDGAPAPARKGNDRPVYVLNEQEPDSVGGVIRDFLRDNPQWTVASLAVQLGYSGRGGSGLHVFLSGSPSYHRSFRYQSSMDRIRSGLRAIKEGNIQPSGSGAEMVFALPLTEELKAWKDLDPRHQYIDVNVGAHASRPASVVSIVKKNPYKMITRSEAEGIRAAMKEKDQSGRWDPESVSRSAISIKMGETSGSFRGSLANHVNAIKSSIPLFAMGRYPNDPHLDSASQKIGVEAPKAPLSERVADMVEYTRRVWEQKLFDRLAGIKNALARTGWQGPAESNPYIQARLTTSLDGQMRAVLEYGHPVWKDGIVQTEGRGLLDILEPVSAPDKLHLWSLYMVGRRAKRLMDEGREHLFTPEEIQAMLDVGNLSQIFEDVAVDYAAFNKHVIDFAEEAGVINPTTRALWENADYIPFYRVMDDRLMGPHSAGNGIANQRSPIKELKGGTAGLGDPVTNIIVNLSAMIDSSTKNHAALMAVDALAGTGVITKVPSIAYDMALVPMGQIKQKLIAAGLNPALIPANVLDGLQKMFVARPPKGDGIISVMRAGKPEFWLTSDEMLFESMTMFNQKRFGGWIKIFSGPKRFLTTMVTLDPGFMLRNYLRDLMSSHVQSRDVSNPVSHLAQSIKGMKQAFMDDEAMRVMRSAGGAFDLGYINVGDVESTRRAVRKAMRSKGFKQTLLDTPARIFEFYRQMGASMENANRIAVYNEAIAAGKSKAQAVYESKDLMDFSMSGSAGVVQFLVQTVPFMGARLQGLHRLGRGLAENPVGFALKGFMWTLAGMALFLKYEDDDRFKSLEQWDRMTYFHFWVGDKHFRIPKGFEVGSIFNSIPELMTEKWLSEEGDSTREMMKGFGFIISQTFSMNPIPQTAQPVVESIFNHNFFTGRQLVTPYEEERLPPEQFVPQTSPLMVELARALPDWMNQVMPKLKSPKHLENLYMGYTGTLGRYAMMGADALVRHAMDYPSVPEKKWQDMPVIGSFFRGTDGDPARVKYEETFYNTMRQAQQVKGSISFLDKMALDDRSESVQSAHDAIISITPELDQIRKQVSDLNAQMMQTWMDPDMTPAEKRNEVDQIQTEKNDLFREAYPLRPGGKDFPKVTEETLKFFLNEYGVDDIPRQLARRNAPMLGDLVRDVIKLDDPDTIRVLRKGVGE